MIDSIALSVSGWRLWDDAFLAQFLEKPCFFLRQERGASAVMPDHGFVSARVDAQDDASIARLQKLGFARICDEIHFVKEGGDTLGDHGCVIITPDQASQWAAPLSQAATIAKTAFVTSRIMCDCRIARPKAQAFKQAWFENFARGKRADIMILAMAGKDCLGFCSVLQKDDQVIIDLIAVAESARRQGVAKRLLSEFLGLPAQIFGVSTQKNNAAQSLYQQAGFTKKAEFVAMHWHG